MNIALITGASSGIGKEFALQMDQHFKSIDEFWLVARRKEQLQELADSLQHKCRILPMDITDEAQLEQLHDTLERNNACIRMLVNCAGFGIMGPFFSQEQKEVTSMVRLNCEALTAVTHICIPYMKYGSRIIQIASSAAFLPQTNFAVYAASKSYVFSLSRALTQELKPLGIYVTTVCPGPVDTPFFNIAEKYDTTMTIKKLTLVDAKDVVALALRDSYHKKEVSVCSTIIKLFRIAAKTIPHSIILPTMKFMK